MTLDFRNLISPVVRFLVSLLMSFFLLASVINYGRNSLEDEPEILGGNGSAVIAYVRVSTKKQVDGFSMGSQEDQLRKRGKELGASKIYWLFDGGKTGTEMSQRKIWQILSLKKQGIANTLLVVTIDRISRKCIPNVLFFLDFCNSGGTIVSLIPDRRYTPDDLMLLISYIFESWRAEQENVVRRQKSIDGKIQALKSLIWPFGYVPPGYKKLVKVEASPGKKERFWLQKDDSLDWEHIFTDAFVVFKETKNKKEVRNYLNEHYPRSFSMREIDSILGEALYSGYVHFANYSEYHASLKWVDSFLFNEVQPMLKESYQRHKRKVTDLETTIRWAQQDFWSLHDLAAKLNEHLGPSSPHKFFAGNGMREKRDCFQVVFGCRGCKPIVEWVLPKMVPINEKTFSKSTVAPLKSLDPTIYHSINKLQKESSSSSLFPFCPNLANEETLDFYQFKNSLAD